MNTSDTPSKLESSYQDLEELDRHVVRLLVLMQHGFTSNQAVKVLNRLKIFGPDGVYFSVYTFDKYLNALCRRQPVFEEHLRRALNGNPAQGRKKRGFREALPDIFDVPLHTLVMWDLVSQGMYGAFAETICQVCFDPHRYRRLDSDMQRREMMLTLWLPERERFEPYFHELRAIAANPHVGRSVSEGLIRLFRSFSPDLVPLMNPHIQVDYLSFFFRYALDRGMDSAPYLGHAHTLLHSDFALDRRKAFVLTQQVLTIQFLEGQLFEQSPSWEDLDAQTGHFWQCCVAMAQGRFDEALDHFERSMAAPAPVSRTTWCSHKGLFALLPMLLCICRSDREGVFRLEPLLEEALNPFPSLLDDYFRGFLAWMASGGNATVMFPLMRPRLSGPAVVDRMLIDWMCNLIQTWTAPSAKAQLQERTLTRVQQLAEAETYPWLVMEMQAIIGDQGLALTSDVVDVAAQIRDFAERTGTQPLLGLMRVVPRWERCLSVLERMNVSGADGPDVHDRRLIWCIDLDKHAYNQVYPRVQKLNAKRGTWSRGREMRPERIVLDLWEEPFLSNQDRHVINLLEALRGYDARHEGITVGHLLHELAGHPLVFEEVKKLVPVELVRGEPQLSLAEGPDGYRVTMSPAPEELREERYVLERQGQSRLIVTLFDEKHLQLAQVLNAGLTVPKTERSRLEKVVANFAPVMTVHSDIESAELRQVEGDPTPHLRLVPRGEGLEVLVVVKPLGDRGPHMNPGTGRSSVIVEVDGERVCAMRDLGAEQRLLDEVVQACPHLAPFADDTPPWFLSELEECLELLLELHELGDRILLEWPEGEAFRVVGRVSSGDMKIQVGSARDWFAIKGKVVVDEDRVLGIRELIRMSLEGEGRFVVLDEGRFLALTQDFRKRLEELDAFSEPNGKEDLRVHPLASFALEDVLADAGEVTTDGAWRQFRERIAEGEVLEAEVPSTLTAELRDYQVEGFRWLARLAHWGMGACLSDDMGLGKTIQALSLMLTRAPQGAALVVAPTSVCLNWEIEIHRFAPTLRPRILAQASDRAETIATAGPFDVLICSYGLLVSEAEALTSRTWHTSVLDEAQAIKNPATRRSKAAMKLVADFKMITTGTPIENHLGELWNLFRFINPGLLGSRDRFNTDFAAPIEKLGDRRARMRLQKLLRPFILRRMKHEVLEELPPRTDIVLHVELSEAERDQYEALRRDALDQLAEPTTKGQGARHLEILSHIMRLRRGCCHPRLALRESRLDSAKLKVFGEVLDELLVNRHKALVFSQFVDYLHIIRDDLNGRGVAYQYLDGSTPQVERQKRVNAFQAGQGEVFLISLKAGGTGLNLTAADYVIHMDPWWNPAVEDQASDRAHRIGQQRPVTVYRLVAKDTIEEKIVDLHRHKRDLAESLLDGADAGTRLSADELLALLRQ